MTTPEYNEEMQFDETDLSSGQSAIQVPPLRRVETLSQVLQDIIKKDSVPKEDLRKHWNQKKSEREKLLKQWNKSKDNVAYWVSKTKMLEAQLNSNSQELERMRGRMIADCMSQD